MSGPPALTIPREARAPRSARPRRREGRRNRRGPAMPADPRRSLGAISARYRASPGCVLRKARDVPGAPERLDSGAQKSDELVRAVGRDSDEAGGRLEPHDGVAIGEEEAVRA